ncbi:unnamed protein product [Lathyrus oleraceus]
MVKLKKEYTEMLRTKTVSTVPFSRTFQRAFPIVSCKDAEMRRSCFLYRLIPASYKLFGPNEIFKPQGGAPTPLHGLKWRVLNNVIK